MNVEQNLPLSMRSIYTFECRDKYGNLKWTEEVKNLVTNAGLNDLLDKHFKGSGYTAAHYVGLIDNAAFTAIAAADTMASHAGWDELAEYDEATRQALTLGAVASQSVSNTAAKAVFTINATKTVKGAFLNTVSTKDGTTGTLYGAAAFSATRDVVDDDTLSVTVTLTAASA